jgi:hypothetical protein
MLSLSATTSLRIRRLASLTVAALAIAAPVAMFTPAANASTARTPSDQANSSMVAQYGWGAAATLAKGQSNDLLAQYGWGAAATVAKHDTYRDKTTIVARQALFADRQPSIGLTGDSPLTRSPAPQPAGLTGDSALTRSPRTLSSASSASDGIDWSSFGLGAGMTALLAAGIAAVVLTTRRRGGIALP